LRESPEAANKKRLMLGLLIHDFVQRRGITAYALSRTDLSYPTAYRLSRPGGTVGRLHARTLDRLLPLLWSSAR
jgi:hypothetical protein